MAQIESGASADVLTVDPTSKAARTTLYDLNGNLVVQPDGAQPSVASGLLVHGLNDERLTAFRTDRLGSIASALHTPLLIESFEGTTIHPLRWLTTATTMAATQSTVAGLTINSGAITTVTTGYMLSSTKRFLKAQRSPLHVKFRARLARVNNSVQELGFGDAATFNGAHTTGAYFQVQSNGSIRPVVTYNSVDVTGNDVSGLIDPARYYTFDIISDDDEVHFTVQDTSTGNIVDFQTIKLGQTAQRLWSASALPVIMRLYNTGVAPASAPQMFVTDVFVLMLDINALRPWSHALAGTERGVAGHPFTGAQLAQWANSAAPASATLSNTAAGYGTLGGLFQFVAVAGAATDYPLFAFAVPVPANLMVTGVEIETWNTGAAVATTPHLLVWGLGVGSTAASLATAGIARYGIGAQSFPVAAAIGAKAERLVKTFETPLHVPSGRFLQVILRMPVATATPSQILQGMVNIEGYFE